MAKNKTKKLIGFWGSYKNSVVGKAAQKQIKRLERAYNRHRSKSVKK